MYIAMLQRYVLENRAGNVKVENEVQFSTLLNNLAFEVNPKVHTYIDNAQFKVHIGAVQVQAQIREQMSGPEIS